MKWSPITIWLMGGKKLVLWFLVGLLLCFAKIHWVKATNESQSLLLLLLLWLRTCAYITGYLVGWGLLYEANLAQQKGIRERKTYKLHLITFFLNRISYFLKAGKFCFNQYWHKSGCCHSCDKWWGQALTWDSFCPPLPGPAEKHGHTAKEREKAAGLTPNCHSHGLQTCFTDHRHLHYPCFLESMIWSQTKKINNTQLNPINDLTVKLKQHSHTIPLLYHYLMQKQSKGR